MLSLPLNTQVNKQLPKAAIYRSFNSNSLPRERFDNDVSKIVIANELSPATLHIAEGKTVKSIFVLNVSLKKKEYDARNIVLLNKLIPQTMLFVLQWNEMIQLAVTYKQLITSAWYQVDEYKLQLSGLNLDTVWENIVKQIGDIHLEGKNTLAEQIAADAEHAATIKQIEMLEKRCWAETQSHKKYELHKQITKLKEKLKQYNYGQTEDAKL